jgi:pyruvate kinase
LPNTGEFSELVGQRKGIRVVNSQISKKRTKIVATLGPSSSDEATIRRMVQAGLNVARINFSHGEHAEHGMRIDLVRRIAQEEGVVVGILCDIQGPKIRIGKIESGGLNLAPGDKVVLTLDPTASGENNVIALPHPEFVRDLSAGMQLLLDDGNLEFVVEEVAGQNLYCRVVIGGLLTSRKGVMAPKARLTLSAITDKDRADIEYAISKKTDYLAMSFVRSADDIREMRWLIRHLGGEDTAIIAKIEKHEALENIESILAASEGIMVARGDLGIETPAEEVPYHQKRIIRLCNNASKPVITATQMLNSMVESPRPTRAEANDVYNAIVDGTDAVMLSNESAAGKYPVVAVETMANIAAIAEMHLDTSNRGTWGSIKSQENSSEATADSISEATYHISEALSPRAIITSTMTGYTARRVARERPRTPIICVTPNETTYSRMSLVWGVTPVLIPEFHTIDEMIQTVVTAVTNAELAKRGDVVIIIAGVPFGVGGQTNLLKIHRIGETTEA